MRIYINFYFIFALICVVVFAAINYDDKDKVFGVTTKLEREIHLHFMSNPLPKELSQCRALALDLATKMKEKQDALDRISKELQKAEDEYKLLYAQIEALKKELDDLTARHEAHWKKQYEDFLAEKKLILEMIEKLKTTGEQTPKQKESVEELDKLLRAVLDEMEKAINRMKENEAIKQLKARIEMLLEQSQPKQKIINDLKAQLLSAQQMLEEAKKMYDDQNKICDELQAKLKKLTEQYHIDAAAAQKIVEYFDKLYSNKTANAYDQKDVDHMRKLMIDFKDRIEKSITKRCEKEQEECDKRTKELQEKIADFTKKEKEMADKLAELQAKLPEAQKAFRDAEMQFTLHQGLYDAKCQECDRILNDNPWYAILSQYLKDMASIKEMLAKVIEAKCIKQAELNNLNKLIDDVMARTQKQLNDKVLEGNVALQRCLAEKAKLYEVFTNWGKVKGKTESELKQLESEIVGMKNTLELVRIDKKSLIDILEAHIQKCKDDIKQCLGDNLWKIEAVNILKQLLTFLP